MGKKTKKKQKKKRWADHHMIVNFFQAEGREKVKQNKGCWK